MPKAIKRGDPPFKTKSDPKITGPKNLPSKKDKVFWGKVDELKKRSKKLQSEYSRMTISLGSPTYGSSGRKEEVSKKWKATNKELTSMIGKGTNYFESLKESSKPYSKRKSNRTDLPKTLKK